jgi:hypothetical protein
MNKIDWRFVMFFCGYSILLLLAGKLSSSYEGCILISKGYYVIRFLYSTIFLLLAGICLSFIRYKFFKNKKQ